MRATLLLTLAATLAACERQPPGADVPVAAGSTVADVAEGLPEAAEAEDASPWAVAAAHPLAVEAGARVLKEGGSAVDAAVAVQAVLGLVEPQSSGLGGGAFMLFYDASTGEVTAYDGREVAPGSAGPDMFLKEDGRPMPFMEALASGRAVGVPGVVAMLGTAHESHGELAWASLFEDAERLASEGFTVTPRLAMLLSRLPGLKEDAGANALFFGEDGRPLREGTTLVNEPYARTVRRLAEEGPATFYTGAVAAEIRAAVDARAGEGTMTAADLAGYEPELREPVCAPVQSYEVCSMGPPSSGGVTLLQILTLYEDATARGVDPLLAYVEASRLAYADRDAYLADPAWMVVGEADAEAVVSGLLSERYLGDRGGLIGDGPADEVAPGEPVAVRARPGDSTGYELPSTSHFSIRDQAGNVVSMTTTVEFAFGSQMVAAGMVLNNQLTDFAREPATDGPPAVNEPAPGKRPRSSMSPTIVLEDGEPVIAIGSPGGPAIIGYVAKTLIGRLFEGAALQAAVETPNVVTAGDGVAVEAQGVADQLEVLGYDEVRVRELTSGLYGFEIVREDGEVATILPAVDPRREGTFETGR